MSRNKSQLPAPPIPKVLLSVDEFLAVAGLGRTHFYELVRQGLVKTVKIGARGVRVPSIEALELPERLANRQADSPKVGAS